MCIVLRVIVEFRELFGHQHPWDSGQGMALVQRVKERTNDGRVLRELGHVLSACNTEFRKQVFPLLGRPTGVVIGCALAFFSKHTKKIALGGTQQK